jgi:6-oxo-cyclohex-1-ene-carbonyl-CoA hydrolase
MIGSEQAMVSGTLCEPFSAHKAYRLGICHEIVPALKIDGQYVPNPMAITDRMLDEFGRIIHGEFRQGAEREKAKQLLKTGEVDLTALDQKVENLCTKLLFTFPECMTKSVEELRNPSCRHGTATKRTPGHGWR